MRSFSIKDLRKTTAGKTGYAIDLAASYERAKAVSGLTSSASAFLNTAVACILTDLNEPARKLIEKSRHWLEQAIAGQERPAHYFLHATEAQRLYDLALCQWLATGIHPVELLQESTAERERWWDSQRKIDRTGFVMGVHQYLDADSRTQLARRIEQLWPDGKRPIEIEVAAQMLAPKPHHEVERLYKQRLPEWLGAGRYADAAGWLKVGRWSHDAQKSPFEIVGEGRKYVE